MSSAASQVLQDSPTQTDVSVTSVISEDSYLKKW